MLLRQTLRNVLWLLVGIAIALTLCIISSRSYLTSKESAKYCTKAAKMQKKDYKTATRDELLEMIREWHSTRGKDEKR